MSQGVQFEEEAYVPRLTEGEKGLIGLLIRTGVVSTRQEANRVFLIIIVSAVVLSGIVFVFFSDPTITPDTAEELEQNMMRVQQGL
jgi:hypothetical protein